jgi:methylamine dehydrogenase heavy chain
MAAARFDNERKGRTVRRVERDRRMGAAGGRLAAMALAGGLALAAPAFAQDAASLPEMEVGDVMTLPPIGMHWGFSANWVRGGITIVDGDSGRVMSTVHSASLANFAIDPAGRYFYVAETIWTKGNRGQRQDMLTIYDATTLKIVAEVAIPGRLLIVNRALNLSVSPDGKHAYVFNLDPATSVIVVDLTRRKFAGVVEIPGCSLAIAAANGTTNSLCSDGSIATVAYDARQRGTLSHLEPFFSATDDPIFDNSIVDPRTGKALFLSYSGLVYEAVLGARPLVAAPWSIHEAAGLRGGIEDPPEVKWLPGGRQPIAFNARTGKAYLLMHLGEFWSHKHPGDELWELDIASRKVLRRRKLDAPMAGVVVTQDAQPLLFLSDDSGKLIVLDAQTLEQKHSLSGAGNGILTVANQ